jgi:hypothetical protein
MNVTERGTVREKAVEELGVAETHLHRIDYVYDHEKIAKSVVEKLDRGEISVSQAYNKVKEIVEKPTEEKPVEPPTCTCPICYTEHPGEDLITVKMCRYCDMEFSSWKVTKDYKEELAAARIKDPSAR